MRDGDWMWKTRGENRKAGRGGFTTFLRYKKDFIKYFLVYYINIKYKMRTSKEQIFSQCGEKIMSLHHASMIFDVGCRKNSNYSSSVA